MELFYVIGRVPPKALTAADRKLIEALPQEQWEVAWRRYVTARSARGNWDQAKRLHAAHWRGEEAHASAN